MTRVEIEARETWARLGMNVRWEWLDGFRVKLIVRDDLARDYRVYVVEGWYQLEKTIWELVTRRR